MENNRGRKKQDRIVLPIAKTYSFVRNGYHSPWTYSPLFAQPDRVKNDHLITLGIRIRAKRKELSWTQEFLADSAEIDRSYIGGVERGERNLTFTILCQICSALRCDVAEITKDIPGVID